ncbi:YagK/YfjJ domain-containing protein [Paraburkholderia terricola]|uniref:YagK/YfjJ domain-containing protein n=1 Tax=Paraburkholderia terricola TaxID=169427 RepID=UPI001FD40188|nr:inovirus-type Gp2 protein [Paraburkholderia terricola]
MYNWNEINNESMVEQVGDVAIAIEHKSKKSTDNPTSNERISDVTRHDKRVDTVKVKGGNDILIDSYFALLFVLDTFMRLVVAGEGLPFSVHEVSGQKRMKKASKLADFFCSVGQVAKAYSSAFAYAPHIQLLFDAYRKHPISSCTCVNPWVLLAGKLEGEHFNDFVMLLQRDAKLQGTAKKLNDWCRRVNKNMRRIARYVDALFDCYARVVTVRVDLHLSGSLVDAEDVSSVMHEVEAAMANDMAAYLCGNDRELVGNALARVGIEEVMAARDHLFANMRGKPSLFEHLIGHVWRIECSRVGGYHLHVAFFFDGSKVRQHEWLAQQICEYWDEVVTDGFGYAHNCNRNRYPDYVLGPTDYDDHDKRGRLLKCLKYLAKEDQLVYAKPTVKCKLFGTGRLRQPTGLGRRRRKE